MEPISVSDFIFDLKKSIESEYKNCFIVGEISNLSHSSAGHYYFTLSDEEASIQCAFFRADAMRNHLSRQLKDGDKVIVGGPVSLYAKRGGLQLIVKSIRKYGIGDLKEKFEQLKRKLAAEGLFDIDRKKTIPLLPQKIAVVTSLQAAALEDFLNVMKRRSLWTDILIIPAVVQGESSAGSLIKALEHVEKIKDIDVCVLTRGGGSLEDLWSFNDEKLARKIASLSVPVISAVGHQVDYSICDFVADLRCETPTAAAEILTQEQTKILDKLFFLRKSLYSKMKEELSTLSSITHQFHPKMLIDKLWELLSMERRKLEKLSLMNRFNDLSRFYEYQQITDSLHSRLREAASKVVRNSYEKNEQLYSVLKATNPKKVLTRGYCYIEDENKNVLGSKREFDEVKPKEKVFINFYDGKSYVLK